ncbi:hypothetical protein [Vibrio sp. 10N.239.312.D08]|uniref:hypothetical protein n=1 Tax=Vibrio sp. 10N.239.312.D08 TaxID=3229978 RepID=UPI0035522960
MKQHHSIYSMAAESSNISTTSKTDEKELYLATGTDADELKYKIAKWHDDECELPFFIYNNQRGSDKYGRCFGVTSSGQVFVQMDLPDRYDESLTEYDLSQALDYVSEKPIPTLRTIVPLLRELGCDISFDLLIMTAEELTIAQNDGCFQCVVEAEDDGTLCWNKSASREQEPIHKVRKGERFWVWDFVCTDSGYTHEYTSGKPVKIDTNVKLKLIYATHDHDDLFLATSNLDKSPKIL